MGEQRITAKNSHNTVRPPLAVLSSDIYSWRKCKEILYFQQNQENTLLFTLGWLTTDIYISGEVPTKEKFIDPVLEKSRICLVKDMHHVTPGEPKSVGQVTITCQMLAWIIQVIWHVILSRSDERWWEALDERFPPYYHPSWHFILIYLARFWNRILFSRN